MKCEERDNQPQGEELQDVSYRPFRDWAPGPALDGFGSDEGWSNQPSQFSTTPLRKTGPRFGMSSPHPSDLPLTLFSDMPEKRVPYPRPTCHVQVKADNPQPFQIPSQTASAAEDAVVFATPAQRGWKIPSNIF